MTPPTGVPVVAYGWPDRSGRQVDTAGLSHGVGQRLQVVGVRNRGRELPGVPHELPATRCGQAHCVVLAKVVGMRLGETGQWADHRGRVRVHVGQRRDGGPATAGTATGPHAPHGSLRIAVLTRALIVAEP